jgi:site-specific DNA recombinase
MVYQGTEVGPAPWEPIVPVDVFRALLDKLSDPRRRTGPGAAPKWLGSGLYRCGICDDGTSVQVRVAGRQPVYRCKNFSHAVRAVAYVDALVVGTILQRLGQDDAADMFLPTVAEVDVTGLRTEAATIKANLKQMAADTVLGRMDKEQMYEASRAGRQRLEQIDTQLQAAVVPSPLSPLIGAEDIQATWKALPLPRQRLILDTLLSVTILPGRRGRGFDPSTVDISWKTPPQ